MNDGRQKVSERRRRFIDAYIQCGVGSEAARRAGYSPKSANTVSAQLLADADIRAEINLRLDELHSQRTAKTAECLEFLTAVMRGEVRDVAVTPGGKPVSIQARVSDRIRATELLLKIFGEFKSPKVCDVADSKADFTKTFIATLQRICGDDETDGESA